MTLKVLLSPPDVGETEEQYVLQALRSGWVAPAGPDLDAFEAEIASRVGVRHAVGLSSGTAALHLALVSWGVGDGDVVIVPTMTFAATANAVCYVGARPHFVDCDPATGNISPELLESALDELAGSGARVRVVIAVDLFGHCADYARIEAVAASRGLKLLCDSAESFGARGAGRPAGSHGDAAVLSFNGNKVMTTSGGGMLLTDDGHLAAHVRKLSTQSREPVPHYEHVEIGYNYRLSNLLAALGRGQLSRLDDMIERRRQWRGAYRDLFADTPGVRLLAPEDDADDNCWLTAVVVNPCAAPWAAEDLGASMARHGVESRRVWKPMHAQPVFAGLSSTLDGSADRIFDYGVVLPSGSKMTDDDFALVSAAVEAVGCR
ncbi:aminotransferase class I/II-fold pyridoxal phosphate-dependent enzyme [Nocardioides sp. HDW12B]|uniref:DegT/DnrJ/EryC1/StrS family aminotransferase n=1 Tax=Nocardioides sp. HDW12B TaxID=2714939 RepID=UPI001407C5F9|nr:aminotransferase class I/II-fold pyridoxal phosphate-dependent enzyme [Nocardioides sp. HDW12B]QIK64956.1 aminotransferase class I/II-fold pyridoxal phosphate-dependent enzyme [Nocardioides sp. HDW12B]